MACYTTSLVLVSVVMVVERRCVLLLLKISQEADFLGKKCKSLLVKQSIGKYQEKHMHVIVSLLQNV